MRNLTRAMMVTLALAGGSSVACGGGDSGPGDVTTGIAPSKLLSDVTAEEAASACENLRTGTEARISREEQVRASCTMLGAVIADTPEDCEARRDSCIEQANNSEQTTDDSAFGIDCSDIPDLGSCEGTVGELESCVNDRLDNADAFLSAPDCADAAAVTAENVGEFWGTQADPASCEALQCDGSPLFGE